MDKKRRDKYKKKHYSHTDIETKHIKKTSKQKKYDRIETIKLKLSFHIKVK